MRPVQAVPDTLRNRGCLPNRRSAGPSRAHAGRRRAAAQLMARPRGRATALWAGDLCGTSCAPARTHAHGTRQQRSAPKRRPRLKAPLRRAAWSGLSALPTHVGMIVQRREELVHETAHWLNQMPPSDGHNQSSPFRASARERLSRAKPRTTNERAGKGKQGWWHGTAAEVRSCICVSAGMDALSASRRIRTRSEQVGGGFDGGDRRGR
jgi:hypothetical protein